MRTSTSETRVLRFDIFELDLQAGELRKRGVKLRLQGSAASSPCGIAEAAGGAGDA
jgi:hypothetical protein